MTLDRVSDRFWDRAEVVCDQVVAAGCVDSPIEALMLDGLLKSMAFRAIDRVFFVHGSEPVDCEIRRGDGLSRFAAVVNMQRQVGPYRVDFAVMLYRLDGRVPGPSFLAVECDGHAYHERTKKQAAHDRARDRFMLRAGWPVMRFTGSEIHANPAACAIEALHFLCLKKGFERAVSNA